MLKALLKKQLLEFLSFFTGSGRSGKRMKKGMLAVIAIVLAYAFVGSGVALYFLFDAICALLCAVNMDWLFFALVGIMSAGISVVLGIFTSQPMLYDAKDNDLLLSLPIPASKILFSRMLLLYLQNVLCSIIVFVPAIVAYGKAVGVKALPFAFQLILVFVLPLISLVIECIVGWLVALVTSRMRKKTIVTLVLSLAMLGAYFYISSKTSEYITLITERAHQLGETVINAFYPFYQMGLGASGDVKGLLIFVGISLAAFAAVYVVLSISFIRIATTKRGAKKLKYTGKVLKTRSIGSALLRKELSRFFTTAIYMLNCGLGVIFHIAIAVLAIVKKDALMELLPVVAVFKDHTLAMVTAVVCLVASMNLITAPSISLEGKNLWLLQSMPVDGWQVLRAKLGLHLLINLPTSILCVAVLGVVMELGAFEIAVALLFTVAFVLLCALVGLVVNLRLPKLDWTSEVVVIKQSASVLVSMLINVGSILALGVLYYLLQKVLAADTVLLIFTAMIVIADVLLKNHLKTKGVEKFNYLG